MQIAEDTDSNNNKDSSKEEDENRIYTNFIYSIKTEVTRELYLRVIKYYMKFLDVITLTELVAKNKLQKIIEFEIKAYLIYLEKQKRFHIILNLYILLL